jgi:hypothetical protein
MIHVMSESPAAWAQLLESTLSLTVGYLVVKYMLNLTDRYDTLQEGMLTLTTCFLCANWSSDITHKGGYAK